MLRGPNRRRPHPMCPRPPRSMTRTMPITPAKSIEPPAMAAVAVALSDISHRYGPRQALAGLSLEIAAGELFAILGPNGGGKTTLFRLLSTLIPLQSGRADILGFDVASQPLEVRRRIGVVFQAP